MRDDQSINPSTFERLCAETGREKKDHVRELIKDYIRNAKEAIDTMKQLACMMDAEARDTPIATERLGRAAHNLKTSSETIGVVELTATCKRMEALVNRGALDEALALVPHLIEQFDRAERDLQTLNDQQAV